MTNTDLNTIVMGQYTIQQKEVLGNRWAVYLGDCLIKTCDTPTEAVEWVEKRQG